MKIESIRDFVKAVYKELKKHADRDDCWNCRQILKYEPLKAFMEEVDQK